MLYTTDGCFEVNAAYPNNDIRKVSTDLQGCQDGCKRINNCRVFTWTGASLETQNEWGTCRYKFSKRKNAEQMSRDKKAYDKRPLLRRGSHPGSPATYKVSGTVRTEENQPVWCEGKTCFKLHLTSLLQCLSPL